MMTPGAVEDVLRAEYALLCLGDHFKGEFDQHAKNLNTERRSIPGKKTVFPLKILTFIH